MLALGRLLIIGFLVLSVVYFCLSLYSRAVRREKLEREWDDQVQQGDRDAFVEAGLSEYDGSLRRKLILGVYIVPLTVISAIIYFTNFH
jgi:preprotein translocase subunit YajC